jgi:hypothetical protein
MDTTSGDAITVVGSGYVAVPASSKTAGKRPAGSQLTDFQVPAGDHSCVFRAIAVAVSTAKKPVNDIDLREKVCVTT